MAIRASVSISEEETITVGNIDYLLIRSSQTSLDFNDPRDGELKLSVVYITEPSDTISKSALQEFRSSILDRDDVFQSAFLANIIFYGAKQEDVEIEPDALNELRAWKTQNWSFVQGTSDSKVAPGPYVLLRGGGIDARVAVPSRCYFNPTKDRPLEGARITVKDNIDVAGHKSTLCNRAWEDLYPPAEKHAACLQTIIDAGAIIVGKVKLQAMIMREEPLECVEYSAPFNPRGDGYQVPSGSSHASAASVASYEWLDYSFGSDTNGSGRKPAHYNGCFSIRPTTGITDTAGVIGQFDKFDMPVFFGRDITKFTNFISVWYGDSQMLKAPSKAPVKILYPTDYLPTPNEAQTSVIHEFVIGLEKAFGVERTKISLADEWAKDLPDGEDNADLAEYLELVGPYPYYHDSYAATEPFRKGYYDKHGKPPFVHRDISKDITIEQRDYYWKRSETYRKWLCEKVLVADSTVTTIMVFPIEVGEPNYRDTVPAPFAPLSGYASLNMSPIARAPEVTAIAGQITYESIVTKREEPYPIGVSVIGAPGTDLILVDLVRKGMESAGIPTQVKTGASVY
ncbi:hypothetical protein LB507_004038 [Fusarium sp. FIESC RH6]|nr:hypothetical protein LB507_004038 [Fusarium sp. FIESC RH6]